MKAAARTLALFFTELRSSRAQQNADYSCRFAVIHDQGKDAKREGNSAIDAIRRVPAGGVLGGVVAAR